MGRQHRRRTSRDTGWREGRIGAAPGRAVRAHPSPVRMTAPGWGSASPRSAPAGPLADGRTRPPPRPPGLSRVGCRPPPRPRPAQRRPRQGRRVAGGQDGCTARPGRPARCPRRVVKAHHKRAGLCLCRRTGQRERRTSCERREAGPNGPTQDGPHSSKRSAGRMCARSRVASADRSPVSLPPLSGRTEAVLDLPAAERNEGAERTGPAGPSASSRAT